MRYIYLFILILLIYSCATNKLVVRSEVISENAFNDSIVFVTMKIRIDSLQHKSDIKVLTIIKKPGTLKGSLDEDIEGKNYLKCVLLDINNIPKDSFCIAHPLFRVFESVDEDNRLFKKDVELKEVEFFVRLEKKNYCTLLIKEYSPVVNDEKIISIKL